MTIEDIAEVLKRAPSLTANGLEQDEHRPDFARDRDELAGDVTGCTRAEAWLTQIEPIKTLNTRHSSYGMKHIAERAGHGYMTNGAFIVAALHRGFWYQPVDSLNVSFNMSERSIAAATEEKRP